MRKIILGLVIGAVIIILLAAILVFLPDKKATAPVGKENSGIEVFSPKENETISSPLKITGLVRGMGWTGFEGQVGTVYLLDLAGNKLALGVLTATTEWTTLPTSFSTTLEFTAASGTLGLLVFKNENASGDLIRDKTFTVPVKFK